MKLTYDPKQNVAYIQFMDAPANITTLKVSESVFIDIASDGVVYGIELLNANNQLFASGNQLTVINKFLGKEKQISLDT